MSNDHSVRFLAALNGASTSRVLNLSQIAQRNKGNAEYADEPLFLSPAINTAFILKHRMRSDEVYQFEAARTMVTKIVAPFDLDDLRAGGRSILVDQRGFKEALRSFGNYSSERLERDLTVIRLVNAIPSLDPFLLREHLNNYKIKVSPCYFAISESDQTQMMEFVTAELSRLTKLLGADGSDVSTRRMVAAMLSSDVADELSPLRETLNLTGEDFRQGVFSWRGFLYYKWSMARLWPSVMGVLRQIKAVQGLSATIPVKVFDQYKDAIIRQVRDSGNDVSHILSYYDNSYAELVANQAPGKFRDFLLAAPAMFLEMGEKIGGISHIVGFWNHRFPKGAPDRIDGDELLSIFQDFSSGLSEKLKQDASPIARPQVIDATAARR